MATMFERYGGFASVSRIVSEFYDRALDSPTLSPYFEGTDMKRLIDHQTKFIASLMGGPASYTNDRLQRIHEPLNITDPAFREVVALLRETFEDFDVEDGDIAAVESELLSRKAYIVCGQ